MSIESIESIGFPTMRKHAAPAFMVLGFLLLLAAMAFSWTYAFTGELYVQLDYPEQVAARPAQDSFLVLSVTRYAPREDIPLLQSASAQQLAGNQRYDAVRLPFVVHLTAAQVLSQPPPREVLEVQQQGETTSIAAETGAQVEVGETTLTLGASQPWTGLLHHPTGEPMAALTLRMSGEKDQRLLLRDGEWLWPLTSLAVCLFWVDSDEAGHRSLPPELSPWLGARWGVDDAERTNWFQTFAPGTGLTLEDGTEITLLEVHPGGPEQPPFLLVEWARSGTRETLKIKPNQKPGTLHPTMRFECPTAAPSVLLLTAWRDGAALAAVYAAGRRITQGTLSEHNLWTPGAEFPGKIRLEQVLARAVPVSASESVAWELPVSGVQQELRLREGELVPWNDAHLRYRRLPQPAENRYVLELRSPGAHALLDAFSLGPGETRRFGAWIFAQSPSRAGGPAAAVLQVERKLSLWFLAPGIILLMLALLLKPRS
ncbi:MAG: hypothetical protein HYV26_13170 [Candidatus Hydrogenedentes bacterium]|nr:hypothetical protein [Candidatus Hydrogenedentota bacterium]